MHPVCSAMVNTRTRTHTHRCHFCTEMARTHVRRRHPTQATDAHTHTHTHRPNLHRAHTHTHTRAPGALFSQGDGFTQGGQGEVEACLLFVEPPQPIERIQGLVRPRSRESDYSNPPHTHTQRHAHRHTYTRAFLHGKV